MSALDDLKTRIDAAIYSNTEQNISGDGLQTVLDDMVDTMGVSVSQNIQTGKEELLIGGTPALVVDNEPEALSDNIVKSGGVFDAIREFDSVEKEVQNEPNSTTQDLELFYVKVGDVVKIKNTASSGVQIRVDRGTTNVQASDWYYSAGTRELTITASGTMKARIVAQTTITKVTATLENQYYQDNSSLDQKFADIATSISNQKSNIVGWLDRGTLYNELTSGYNRTCIFLPITDVNATYHIELSYVNINGSYMFIKIAPAKTTGTSDAIGDITYIYNNTKRTINIELTDAQKASGKYIVITGGTNNIITTFRCVAYILNSDLPTDYNRLEKQNCNRANVVSSYGIVNANNIERKFVLVASLEFRANGELKSINSDISYNWSLNSGYIVVMSYVYNTDIDSYSFKPTKELSSSDVIIFTFVCRGKTSEGTCEVLRPCIGSVTMFIDGQKVVDTPYATYTGERIDIGYHSYNRYKFYNADDITPAISHSYNVQGAAMYNDRYVIQCVEDSPDAYLSIVDVTTMSKLGEFKLDLGEYCHGNCVSLGEKYDESDTFPLVYIDQRDGTNWLFKCFVLRLANDASSYTLVQTIRYGGERYETSRSIGWIVDVENGHLISYSMSRSSSTEFLIFNLPVLELQSVVLEDSDIIDSFTIGKDFNQGGCIISGKAYFANGVGGGTIEPELLVVNLNTKKLTTTLDMAWSLEPQNCFRYKNSLVVGSSGTTYWVLSFN